MPPIYSVPGRNYLNYMPDYKDLIQNLQDQHSISYKDLMAADKLDQAQDQFRILRAVITPEECLNQPVRYKDEFNTDPTAALGLMMNEKCNWQAQPIAANAVNEQLGPNDMFIATFNDSPFCIMVMYRPNPNYSLWSYNWTMNGNTTLKVGQVGGVVMHNRAIATSAWRPHDIHVYSGMDKMGYRYQWVDVKNGAVDAAGNVRNSTIVVTVLVPGAGGAALFTVNLVRFNNGEPRVVARTVYAAGDAPVTFTLAANTFSDYYAVTITSPAQTAAANAAVDGGFTIASSGVCSNLGHFATKNITAHLTSLSKQGRINALGIRLTDVAMYQYLNGECTVVRSEEGNAWYPLFQAGLAGGTTCYDTTADYPGAIVGELKDGAYTYHRPVSKKDYDWKNWVTLDPVTGQVLDVWCPLETNSPVMIIVATTQNDNSAGNPNGQGAICYVTVAIMLEYKTLDDWTPIDKPMEQKQAWSDALEKIELFPIATGNAWHWQDMLHGISKVVNWTKPLWRAAIEAGGSALDKYDPALGGAARKVGNVVLNEAAGYAGKRKQR